MGPEQPFTGRPLKRLKLTLILGQMATAAYEDGERDLQKLKSLGTIKREEFDSLPEMNAYMKGVEDATGYLTSLIIED